MQSSNPLTDHTPLRSLSLRLHERRAICFEINGLAHAAHLTGAKWRMFFAFIWLWSLMYRAQCYVLRRLKRA